MSNTNENSLKLLDILELIYKIYPFVLIFFLLLDLGTLVGIFNIDLGYFNTIFLSNSNSSMLLSIVFIYILIPVTFISVFVFSSIFSLYIAIFFFSIKKITKFFIRQIKCSKIAVSLVILLFLFFIIFEWIFPLINSIFMNKQSFIIVFSVLLAILVVLNILTLTLRIILKNINFVNNSINLIDVIVICLVIVIANIFKEYVFVAFLYGLFYFISMFFYNTIFSTSNNISRSSKFQKKLYEIFKVKYLLIFLAIFILFNYFHYLNLVYWEEPINKIKNKNDSFQNLSLNLMFNRGMLLNNTNDIEFEISSSFFNNLDDKNDIKKFFKNTFNIDINNKFILNKDCKYLELNSNLKMYFKPINDNKVIIFLIEERKFTNNKDSSFSLITLGSYRIKEVKKL